MDGARFPEFTPVPVHGGRYLRYNIFDNVLELTSKYRPPIVPIGRGAYGIVCSAMDSETNEMVAIKKIANAFDNYMDAKRTLREIKLLKHLDHENVIGIRDVLPPPVPGAFNDVYIATELMDVDLHNIIRSNQELSEEHCQYFLYQILRGLKYIHSASVIHRDLKPSNLLLNANCDLKICDFGLARPATEAVLTEYVVTRWYRAPELLLSSSEYTAAIDVWSVGCIYLELLNRRPLFPGRDHVHQMKLVTQGMDHLLQWDLQKQFEPLDRFTRFYTLVGTPTEAELQFLGSEDGRRILRHMPPAPRRSFAREFPHIHPDAINLLERMLTFDPTRRITVEEALAHPYLSKLHDIADEPVCMEPFSFDFEMTATNEDQIRQLIYEESLMYNPGHATHAGRSRDRLTSSNSIF